MTSFDLASGETTTVCKLKFANDLFVVKMHCCRYNLQKCTHT